MKTLISIFALVLMTGCATIPEPEVQTQYIKEYVHVKVPSAFYAPVQIPKPMTKEEYISLPFDKKEYELIMYSNSLLASIAQYQLIQSKLKQWDSEQSLIYKPTDTKDSGNGTKGK